MPYKRYDIKNKYNRRGRRVNEKVWLNILLLILIPVLIVTVVLLGVFLPMKFATGDLEVSTTIAVVEATESAEEEVVVSDAELLRIVNDTHPVEKDFKPELVPFGNVRVSKLLFYDLDKLISDATEQDINISVQIGYVSYDEQENLFSETLKKIKAEGGYSEIKAKSETRKVCPEAGCSEAQTGLLVTFSTNEECAFADSQAFKWLTKYSVNYGFILRYPEDEEEVTGRKYDPATYRYVGIENAKKMRKFDMTLEAYSAHINSR